jgi:hypothetical protein
MRIIPMDGALAGQRELSLTARAYPIRISRDWSDLSSWDAGRRTASSLVIPEIINVARWVMLSVIRSHNAKKSRRFNIDTAGFQTGECSTSEMSLVRVKASVMLFTDACADLGNHSGRAETRRSKCEREGSRLIGIST